MRARKFGVRKILVPVDFSEPSLIAIGYASAVATRLGAELNWFMSPNHYRHPSEHISRISFGPGE